MTSHGSSTPDPGVNVNALLSLPLAVFCSVAGVVLAHAARREIRRTGQRGGGLTTVALLIGYPTTLVWATCLVSLIISVALTE